MDEKRKSLVFVVRAPTDAGGWVRLREVVDALKQATTDEALAMLLPAYLPQLHAMLSPGSEIFDFVEEQMWGDARMAVDYADKLLARWGV